jgi:archaeoflavoprotein AfpA
LAESSGKNIRRIAWGITGCANHFVATYDVMVDIKERTGLEPMVFLSREGRNVLERYQLLDRIQKDFPKFNVENGPNTPFIAAPLQLGYYDLLLIAPATANTVAKIVCGIADTLVTNAVAQTAKGKTPIYILPADRKSGTVKTIAPNGKSFDLRMRRVDVENTEKLEKMENITVLGSPGEIYGLVGLEPPARR